MTTTNCESCGMPLLEAADHARGDMASALCRHCTDDAGHLQPFEERFERMTQWAMRQDGLDRAVAEERTRQYMRGMPAWRDHPALREA